jgi:hypothetical protein
VAATATGVPATWTLTVRVAWFQRARDVSMYTQRRGRARAPEPQLLLATMHSDVNPADAVRGRCTVTYMGEVRGRTVCMCIGISGKSNKLTRGWLGHFNTHAD